MVSQRQHTILKQLEIADRTYAELAVRLGFPEPSLRRDVQALRRQGYQILPYPSIGNQVDLCLRGFDKSVNQTV